MNFLIHYCFSLFRLLQQSTTDWLAYKQQKFISHSSGVWKTKMGMPACSDECLTRTLTLQKGLGSSVRALL